MAIVWVLCGQPQTHDVRILEGYTDGVWVCSGSDSRPRNSRWAAAPEASGHLTPPFSTSIHLGKQCVYLHRSGLDKKLWGNVKLCVHIKQSFPSYIQAFTLTIRSQQT